MNIPMEDHRAPDLGDFVRPLLHDIKDVFKTVTGSVVVFPILELVDAVRIKTVLSLVIEFSLMSQFGQFSKLWVQMCEDMNLSVHNIPMDWGDQHRLIDIVVY